MSTLTVQPDATAGIDTYIDPTQPNQVALDATIINFGLITIGNIYRSLIRFNLSAIPSDAHVSAAAMTLIVSAEFYPGPLIFYRLTQSAWTEAATANKYDGTHNWITVGGDYVSSMAAVASIPLGLVKTVVVDAPDFIVMVQDAVTNRSGILNMIGIAEPAGATGFFYSSDWAVAALRPKVVVEYTTDVVIIGPPEDPPGEATIIIQSDPFPLSPTQTILANRTF